MQSLGLPYVMAFKMGLQRALWVLCPEKEREKKPEVLSRRTKLLLLPKAIIRVAGLSYLDQ